MTPEIQEEGLVAYEQARAFEALRRRRLPLIYALIPICLLACGGVAWKWNQPLLAATCVAVTILLWIFAAWNWRRLRSLYAYNLALLARLEKEYGENVPWLEVERQLAALDLIKAEEKGKASEPDVSDA